MAEEERSAIPVQEDEIIDINAGGTKITTLRSTLCQAEGSVLAAMFSGRWERSCLPRDAQGAYFLDVDPYCMTKLLTYLRDYSIKPLGLQLPEPSMPDDKRLTWNLMLKFLGIESLFRMPPTRPSFTFTTASPGLHVDPATSTHSLLRYNLPAPGSCAYASCTPGVSCDACWVFRRHDSFTGWDAFVGVTSDPSDPLAVVSTKFYGRHLNNNNSNIHAPAPSLLVRVDMRRRGLQFLSLPAHPHPFASSEVIHLPPHVTTWFPCVIMQVRGQFPNKRQAPLLEIVQASTEEMDLAFPPEVATDCEMVTTSS